jgi:hypothetical protein
MKEETLVIELQPGGGLTVDADGFTDGACIEEIERLLEGLAGAAEEVRRKPDVADKAARRRRAQRLGRKR